MVKTAVSRGSVRGPGRTAPVVWDRFDRYPNGALPSPMTPAAGKNWYVTGAGTASITNGKLTSTSTNYLMQRGFTTPIRVVTAEVTFAGDPTTITGCIAIVKEGANIVDNLIHLTFGASGMNFTLQKDNTRVFDTLMNAPWSTPCLPDDTTVYRITLIVQGDTATVIGPHGEVFSRADPRVAEIGEGGTSAFWQPFRSGSDVCNFVSSWAATSLSTVSPFGIPDISVWAGQVIDQDFYGRSLGSPHSFGQVALGKLPTDMPGITFGGSTIYTRLANATAVGATSIDTYHRIPKNSSIKIDLGTDEETVTASTTASAGSSGAGVYPRPLAAALTKAHPAGKSVVVTCPTSRSMFYNQENDWFYLADAPVTILPQGNLYIGSALDSFIRRVAADIMGPGAGDSWYVDGTWNGGKIRTGPVRMWWDSTNSVMRYKTSDPTSETDGTSLQGPAGATGAQGNTGAAGAQGATGGTGPQGATGPAGLLPGHIVVTNTAYAGGAKGDGVTDDTAAIQAAIDASTYGQTIYFPPGIYLVSACLRIPANRVILGAGGRAQLVTIKAASGLTGGAVMAAKGWYDSAASCDNPIRIVGIQIDTSGVAGAHGLVVYNFWSHFEDIQVRNVAGAAACGILATDRGRNGTTVTNNSHSENTFVRCRFYDHTGKSTAFKGESNNGQSNQDGHLLDSFFAGISGDGIRIGRAAGWSIENNHLYGIGYNGIALTLCYATKVLRNYVEDFGGDNGANNGAAPTYGYYNGIAMETVLDTRASIMAGNTVSTAQPGGSGAAVGNQWCCFYARAGSGQVYANVVIEGNTAVFASSTAPAQAKSWAFRLGEGGDSGRTLSVEWAGNQIQNVAWWAGQRFVHAATVVMDEPPLLDALGRVQAAQMPLVPTPVRTGSVSSALTSDASTGAGNAIDLTVTGNSTLNISAPANHQRLTYHLLASGAARVITLGAAIIVPPGQPTSYTIPQNTVLTVEVEYVGNRPTPAWLVTRVRFSDSGDPIPFGAVARHRRTSNATAVTATTPTTAQGVIRMTGRTLLAGRCYRIRVDGMLICTAASNVAGVQITFTIDGTTTPTVSSAVLEQGYYNCGPVANISQQFTYEALYVPTSNVTFQALLSYWRQSGSGTVTMQGSTASPLDLQIDDLGPDLGGADGVNI